MTESLPSAPAPTAIRDIAGVRVAALDQAQALARVGAALAGAKPLKLAFCNAHVVNLAAHDARFRAALETCLVLPDGIGVDIGSRLLYGAPFPANLNGTDFIPALLRDSAAGLAVSLYGAKPGVAERAAARLARDYPRHRFSVAGDGFQTQDGQRAMLAGLAAAPPDLLLVALGNPGQEIFIAERIEARHARVAAGVGALFDFLAGEVPRAPQALRRLRLEWVYRLAREPGRLWRRYVLGNPVFLLRVLHIKLARIRTAKRS